MTTYCITGASRGIGFGLTEKLTARGDRVIAGVRDPNAPALAKLAKDRPGLITAHRCDVSDDASVAAFARALGGKPIDVLINNAGIRGPKPQNALDVDLAAFAEVLATNTLAPLRVARALLPNLRAAPKARIITVSSIMGQLSRSGPGDVAYCTSKTAVNKVMQTLAAELQADGIMVAMVHPGWVKTDMGGAIAPLSVDQSTTGLVATIDRLTFDNTGGFFNYDGKPLAW